VKRKPAFCLVESIASTVRIRMRVPAGTVILFFVCASAGPAARLADNVDAELPLPEFGLMIAIPARRVATPMNVFRMYISPHPGNYEP
jgi:hypothetical protein